jgi:hypothetical protein
LGTGGGSGTTGGGGDDGSSGAGDSTTDSATDSATGTEPPEADAWGPCFDAEENTSLTCPEGFGCGVPVDMNYTPQGSLCAQLCNEQPCEQLDGWAGTLVCEHSSCELRCAVDDWCPAGMFCSSASGCLWPIEADCMLRAEPCQHDNDCCADRPCMDNGAGESFCGCVPIGAECYSLAECCSGECTDAMFCSS